ncbi:MAG: hypothetical protein GXP33_12545 [Spirochaetes bacterium]|nr:hypothetical protein [Spirochaetota bacterium]
MGLQLLVPIKGHRNNRAGSEMQRLSMYKKLSDEKAILRWNDVNCSHSGKLNISVTLQVSLKGPSAYFNIFIDNKSPYFVEEVWNPCIGGLRKPEGEPDLESWSMNMCGGFSKHILGDGFPQECGYFGTDYPTFLKTFPNIEAQASFILLTNNIQGLYMGMHDKELNIVNFVHELKPGYLDSKNKRVPLSDMIGNKPAGFVVSAVRMPFIKPGESMELAPMVIHLYRGSWHRGIEPYKKWRRTWFRAKPMPDWLSSIDCWLTLHMNSPEGGCRYRYNDLADIAQEAKDHGVGALQLIGWARDGQDGAEPYQDTDPRLGTREELKNAIRQIEALGIRVLLMCKFKWADRSIPEFKSELLPLTLKDMYGSFVQFDGYAYQTMSQYLTGGSRRTGAGLCHLSKKYRTLALREFKKIIELGSSGILYDELASNMLMCFDASHRHRRGESNFKGSLKLADEFYQAAHLARDDFLMAGEGPNDHLSQYYPVSYIRTWNGQWGSWNEKNHIAAWKFMNPDMTFATCLTGWDDREMVNQCLVCGYIINYEPYNFKGRITDFPDTVAYGIKAQKLRRKLRHYIWKGKFNDTLGIEASFSFASEGSFNISSDNSSGISPDGEKPACLYSVFENRENHKRAVIIANQHPEYQLKAIISLVNSGSDFDVYDIENDQVERCSGSLTVKRRSVKVLVER